jgi:hypothetical protein
MSSRQTFFQKYLDEENSQDDDDFYALTFAHVVNSLSNDERRHVGSVPGHAVIHRDRKGGHDRMYKDYLAENPTYGPELFRRRLVCSHICSSSF